jgi:hypothetical protein
MVLLVASHDAVRRTLAFAFALVALEGLAGVDAWFWSNNGDGNPCGLRFVNGASTYAVVCVLAATHCLQWCVTDYVTTIACVPLRYSRCIPGCPLGIRMCCIAQLHAALVARDVLAPSLLIT